MSQRNPERSAQVALAKSAALVIFITLFAAALVYFLIKARGALAVIALAAFIAAALDHPVRFLQKYRIPRWIAFSFAIVGLLGLIAGVLFLVIPMAVSQLENLIQRAPSVIHSVRSGSTFRSLDRLFHFSTKIEDAGSQVPQIVEQSFNPALKAVSSVFSLAIGFLTTVVLTIFMFAFGGKLVAAALAEATAANRVRYRRVLAKIHQSVGGYVVGIFTICLINATLTTVLLAILKVPFFFPLGMISGFSSLVPYAGPIVVGTSITLVTLATSGIVKAAIMAIFYILYGQLEGNVLGPLVFNRTVKVNPLITVMSLVVLGHLAGVAGAVVAVPLAAIGQVILREILVLRRERLNLPLAGEAGSVEELSQAEIKRLASEDAGHKQREVSGM